MARIAIDARIINTGTGTYVWKLLEYLQELDHSNQYQVLVMRKDLDYWRPSAPNFEVIPVDYPNYTFAEQFGYLKFLNQLDADLVHFCMPQQPILYRGLHVTTVHDLIPLHTYNQDKNWLVYHIKQIVARYVFRYVGKTSAHVFAISKSTRDEYQKFARIADDKLTLTYEAGEARPKDIEATEIPFKDFIIYVGQQPSYKNILRLAEAHQRLLEKHPKLGLILVGRINKNTAMNRHEIQARGYKNIHFTGYLPDAERDYLYKKAQAYVFPSLMEGFGLPPLEAMAYGVPVVSSNASCMPEVLGNAAEYFNPLDTDDMAAAIERVISSKSLQKSLIKKGYKRVQKYSWKRMARQTLAVYKSVLKNQ